MTNPITITFRRGTTPPSQASGLTLGEPAFDTTDCNLYIGLGNGITAAWVGARISGSSGDIAAGLTTWIPTASAVKDYVTSESVGVGLTDGDKGDVVVSGSGATLTVESVGGIRIGAATGGTNSIVFGIGTLEVSTGDGNVAIGNLALDANTSGFYNTAVGHNALSGITSQFRCTAVGWNALSQNTAARNVAVGSGALQSNTTGSQNCAFGNNTLQNNTKGNNNMGIGAGCLAANTEGGGHVAIGAGALANISATDSVNLIAIGSEAGRYLPNGTTGLTGASRCVYIGAGVRGSTYGETNAIVIGDNLISNGSNTVLIGNTAMVSTTLNGLVDMAGGLSAAGATLSGNVTAPTQPVGTNNTNVATTEFVKNEIVADTVTSFNGLTGAVSGVTLGGVNTFTKTNAFNSGLCASGGITFGGSISLQNSTLSLRGGAIFITDSSGVIPPYTYIDKNGVYATNSISIGSFAAHPVMDFYGYSTHGSCGGIIRFGVCANNGNIQTSLKGFIKNLSDPVETYDAANKNYVDNFTVTSFNGLTGAVSGVTLGGVNTFTKTNTFNSGLCASGGITFGGDIFSFGNFSQLGSLSSLGPLTQISNNIWIIDQLLSSSHNGYTMSFYSGISSTRGGCIEFGRSWTTGGLLTTSQGQIKNLANPGETFDAANKNYVDNFTVTSFNGLTGAVTGVGSVNGSTGAITNIARTNTGNIFSGTQQFTDSTLGITAAVIQSTELHTNNILPTASTKHIVSILPRGSFGTDYNAPVQTGIRMLSFSESLDEGNITLRPAFKEGSLSGVTIDFPYKSGTVALTTVDNTFTGVQNFTAGLSAAGGVTFAGALRGTTASFNSFRINNSSTPVSTSDTGTTGDIRWDSNYIYVCIGTNSWMRAGLTSW